jgi:hypothetical protein
VLRNHEQNPYPFLRIERQFVDEFYDALEIEVVVWGDGYLGEDCEI